MGLFDFLFGSSEQSKEKLRRSMYHPNTPTYGMFGGMYDHWPGMSVPHSDTTTPRVAKRITNGVLQELPVKKCSECPFSCMGYIGITRPSQYDCHHPNITPWNSSYGKPYLFPIEYESFPDWCPLLTCKPPEFDSEGNQLLSGTIVKPATGGAVDETNPILNDHYDIGLAAGGVNIFRDDYF